eukprot:184600-Heterocapsa_arctica.AAC.1
MGIDANAIVKPEVGDERYIGQWTIGDMDGRGADFKRWCVGSRFILLNTHFQKTPNKFYTNVFPQGFTRTIDYIGVRSRDIRCTNSEARDIPSILTDSLTTMRFWHNYIFRVRAKGHPGGGRGE